MKNIIDECVNKYGFTEYIMKAKDIPPQPIQEPSFKKCPACNKPAIFRKNARKIQVTKALGVYDGIEYALTVICPECHIQKTFITKVTDVYGSTTLNSLWKNLKPADLRLVGVQAAVCWWNSLSKSDANEMKAEFKKDRTKIPATNDPTLIDYYYLAYRWPDRSFNISDGKMDPVMMQPNNLSEDAETLYKSGVMNIYADRLLKRAEVNTQTMFAVKNIQTESKTQFQILSELRDGFIKALTAAKHPRHNEKLILQAKIIAIGQAMDALGLSDEQEPEDLDEILNSLYD